MKQFKLPDVGEGLTEAEIVSWKVKPGDTVKVNEIIVEIETAKSLVELPCPFAGVVTDLLGWRDGRGRVTDGVDDDGGRSCRGRRLSVARDRDDRRSDLDRLAFFDEQRADLADEGRRQLDERLRSLDLDEHLVHRHRVARLDLPRHDLGLGEAFAHVG